MIKTGPKYMKLKTDLQLACNRLKMLQAKKMELSEKLKREIANHLINGKFMISKIKVQSVIRYEATQEAMEIIEMFCEQILDRYGLFEETKEIDKNLEQAISSLIWVSPYMRSEVLELKDIFKQLAIKYGSHYSKRVLKDKYKTVSVDLMERVKIITPSESKMKQYLNDIAEKFNVPEDKKIEIEIYFSNDNHSSKVNQKNNYSSSPNHSVSLEDGEYSETYEGYGTSTPNTLITCKKAFSNLKFGKNKGPSVKWTRKLFHDNSLSEENEDNQRKHSLHIHDNKTTFDEEELNNTHKCKQFVNRKDTITDSSSRKTKICGINNIDPKKSVKNKNSVCKDKVSPTSEMKSNFLLSTYKKKGNLRIKIPNKCEDEDDDDDAHTLKENHHSDSKKSDNIKSYAKELNIFRDNNSDNSDSDEPPPYEVVVSDSNSENFCNESPYKDEADTQPECFPQYPILPTCPALDDIFKDNDEFRERDVKNTDSESEEETVSEKKKINKQNKNEKN
ncbi:IST1 homolog [Caerostris darwini]|uniref:IST1 homolog n=1 Tax=Caerostris darwini TaxID=1538125 RepID=A0AAV4WZF2_9ARAC|nr:IST1 homolog [Caerostris darwini]